MSGHDVSKRHQDGMTLVEIAVVLVIISILAIFVAPEMTKWGPRMNLKAAGEDLFTALQRAKVYAIKNNVNVLFTFTPPAACPGGTYTFTDNATPSNTVVAGNVTKYSGVCLATTFVAGDGFTSRGLPINPGSKTVTVSNSSLGTVKYVITQTAAGGVTLDKL